MEPKDHNTCKKKKDILGSFSLRKSNQTVIFLHTPSWHLVVVLDLT